MRGYCRLYGRENPTSALVIYLSVISHFRVSDLCLSGTDLLETKYENLEAVDVAQKEDRTVVFR